MALGRTLARIFYGARNGIGRTDPWARRLFLPVAAIPLVLALLGMLLIEVVVDPYDIRPWGLQPRIADHRYPDLEWPLLLNVVSKEDHGLVVIGASTLMALNHDDLAKAFGTETRPVNLAYPYAAPRDTRIVVDTVARMPSVKRVIFIMDHSQMMGMSENRLPARLREQVFQSDWAHAGDFRWDTLAASWNRVTTGKYDRAAWKRLRYPNFFVNFTSLNNQPRTLERMRAAIERHRGDVIGVGVDAACHKYPFLKKVLTPALDKFRGRGMTVDLVFPPYPYAGYYDWIDRRTSNDPFTPGPVYPQLMSFKRCVVGIAARYGAQVTVHAADNDPRIAGQIGNYSDNVHIIRPEVLTYFLGSVAKRNNVLTQANFDRFDHTLRSKIKNYRM